MTYIESKIGSIQTLLKVIASNDDKEHSFFYRGHANKSYELTPSIYRKKNWYSNESKIIREVISRCPAEFSSKPSAFEKLVKMQHYDLPTRLLDITGNPLVALYFACVGNEEKKDGEFLTFKLPTSEVKYFDSDTVTVLSNLAWAKSDFELSDEYNGSFEDFHNQSNHHALKLTHDIRQEKPHFLERIEPKDLESVICVRPKMDNPRVVRQDGAFFLFGISQNKYYPAKIQSDWIEQASEKRYIIKSKDKQKLLKQLAILGISKATLFPEIDMVSQFIKNDYGLSEEEFSSTLKPESDYFLDAWG